MIKEFNKPPTTSTTIKTEDHYILTLDRSGSMSCNDGYSKNRWD